MILILLIIGVTSSVLSAPVEENELYNIVVNDNRTESLRKYPFVAECKETTNFSKSLCFAMFDVTLLFYNQKSEFITANATYEEGNFCKALTRVLPDKPNNESLKAFDHLAPWFKDTLIKNGGEEYCKENCYFTDKYSSYSKELLPVCQFLFNQFSVLSNQNETPAVSSPANNDEIKANEVKISQPESVDVPVAIVPAALEEVGQKNVSDSSKESFKSSNESVAKQEAPPAPQENKSQDVVITEAPLKPIAQTTPVASGVKKSETTKPEVAEKPEAPLKPEDPINLDNIDNIDQSPFDDQMESADDQKESEPKVDNAFQEDVPDDDDTYSEDLMARDNNKVNDNKLPQEEQRVYPTKEDEVRRKKVEFVDFQEDPDSNFFVYLCGLMFLCVLLYILHKNRHKILACILEGRRGNRRGRERSRGGSKAAYSKLDCNLEEAITSKKSLSGKSMDIIY